MESLSCFIAAKSRQSRQLEAGAGLVGGPAVAGTPARLPVGQAGKDTGLGPENLTKENEV